MVFSDGVRLFFRSGYVDMQTEVSTDHRVRVGRQKREKMRKRLLQSVMVCYAAREDHTTPGIDDVIREADVSRATFYLHFASMEEAFNALRADLDDDLTVVEHFFERSDPLERLAIGTLIFLFRSVTDPTYAKFVASTNYLSDNVVSIVAIEHHLLKAREAKLVHFTVVAAARDLLLGSMLEAMRSLSKASDRNRAYVEEITVMILCGLRADHARCKEVVHDCVIYIRGYAPDCLPWWRDPWAG